MPECQRPQHCPSRRQALATLLALGGCASPPPLPAELTALRAGPGQALLLGETHDNATQHALRRDLLATLLARGDRPALLLEQLDRERQPAVDAASISHSVGGFGSAQGYALIGPDTTAVVPGDTVDVLRLQP